MNYIVFLTVFPWALGQSIDSGRRQAFDKPRLGYDKHFDQFRWHEETARAKNVFNKINTFFKKPIKIPNFFEPSPAGI